MNIAGLLFGVARRLPDRPALSGAGTQHSYGEFARRVSWIAGALTARHGLRPGDRVVIFMENRPEFLEVLFACWTAGLCAVPVNAKLHAREVEYILQDSGAGLCLTTPGLAERITGLDGQVRGLRAIVSTEGADYATLLGGEPSAVREAAPDDNAWLFYTSGTTGRPKGAVLSHRNLLFMSHCYYADIDALDETDTWIHSAPLSHGSGLYALPHMFRGGHQVVLGGFDPAELLDTIARHRNASLFAAPTMVTRLVNTPGIRAADMENLKTICYGGGPMYVADLERALGIFGPRLYQIYGQGESPMTITGLSKAMHAETGHPRYEERLASCGVPRTGVEVRVVDEDGREVPPGTVGEVVTRSDCVMKEYWRNPEASARTLRGGWLHTGDLGAMDEEGFLYLRDRSKDMIISGGANIYPREIEEVLLRHPDVAECSVVGRPHPDWGEEVVAFIVAREGAALTPEALDRLCLDNIARFKRPREYRFTRSLPKNNYGKVLKTDLRATLREEVGSA